MLAKLRYLVYILYVEYCAVSAATSEGIDKRGTDIQSKVIQIADLQGSLNGVEVNATYKDIQVLTFVGTGNLSLLPALVPSANNGNNLQNTQTSQLEAKLKDLSAIFTRLNAQLENLKASIRLLSNTINQKKPRLDCSNRESWENVVQITVPGISPFSVLCDKETDWIVIQRRLDGSIDFYRNWQEYRDGFGSYNGEFFVGLEIIYRLTNSRPYELYVELVDFEDSYYYARYDDFLISSEREKYKLTVLGTYTGNAGDALRYNLYDKFSTYDSDNGKWFWGNCANYYESGGWFNSNANSNLNGVYIKNGKRSKKGIWWYTLKGYQSLKSVKMLIRPKYTLV